MARTRLADARLAGASREGRFTSAYSAAHQKRNLAEYEGVLEVEESAIKELIALAAELIAEVAKLVQLPK
jgi:hypothetical protein